jgi:hypothetical protein
LLLRVGDRACLFVAAFNAENGRRPGPGAQHGLFSGGKSGHRYHYLRGAWGSLSIIYQANLWRFFVFGDVSGM